MSVTDWQFDLNGLLFGAGTPYRVQEMEHGKPETRANDTPFPREDGIRFGRDHLAGQILSFQVGVEGADSETVLDLVAAMRSVWQTATTRDKAGLAVPLRLKRPGRDALRVYGRPREFSVATMHNVSSGWVPVVCDFQCVDHLFYADVEESVSISIAPPAAGGLVEPLTEPLTATSATAGTGQVTVGGEEPTWLVARSNGPVLDPVVEVVGRWSATMRADLAFDEWITADPTPWGRSVLRNGVSNAAGVFTQDSRRLSRWQIPPGQQEIVLRGTDATGTASLLLSWRPAYSSY